MPAKATLIEKPKPKPTNPKAKSYYIPTEKTPGFQELIGGVPRGTIFGFLGAPEACKTMLSVQIGTEVAIAEEANFLVIDTENKFHQHLALIPGLAERFGANVNLVRVGYEVVSKGGGDNKKTTVEFEMLDDVDPKATNVFLVHCPDIIPISVMLGRGVDLKVFESGKFKVMMDPSAWVDKIPDTPLGRFLTQNKVGVILLDSFTNPLDEIPAVGENFPARTDLTQVVFLQAHKIAQVFDIPFLMTFHESKNETNPFSKQLKYEGGKGVGYNLPFIAYMLKVNEQGLLPKGAAKPKTLARDERAMFIARHAGRPPWKQVKYFTITDTGLSDGESDGGDDSSDDTE